MLSKEEIEAFLDEGDDYETVSPVHSPNVPSQMAGGVRMMTLATRTQFAMFRAWQSAFRVGR